MRTRPVDPLHAQVRLLARLAVRAWPVTVAASVLILIVMLFVIVFVPEVSLWLPGLMGLL